MFSQVSVWGWVGGISGPMSFRGGVNYPWYQIPSGGWVLAAPWGGYVWGWVDIQHGWVLTSSGSGGEGAMDMLPPALLK